MKNYPCSKNERGRLVLFYFVVTGVTWSEHSTCVCVLVRVLIVTWKVVCLDAAVVV